MRVPRSARSAARGLQSPRGSKHASRPPRARSARAEALPRRVEARPGRGAGLTIDRAVSVRERHLDQPTGPGSRSDYLDPRRTFGPVGCSADGANFPLPAPGHPNGYRTVPAARGRRFYRVPAARPNAAQYLPGVSHGQAGARARTPSLAVPRPGAASVKPGAAQSVRGSAALQSSSRVLARRCSAAPQSAVRPDRRRVRLRHPLAAEHRIGVGGLRQRQSAAERHRR